MKYLSIKERIDGPKWNIIRDTRKNLAPLLSTEAMKKTVKSALKNPADIVKTLYGIGVKPAMLTAHASYLMK
mgnify:CR=1 FL=1